MNIHPERQWMYNRTYPNRMGIRPEFERGVNSFVQHAMGLDYVIREGNIRCPCKKCIGKGTVLTPIETKVHLYKNGFKPNYWYWTDHGEVAPPVASAPRSGNGGLSSGHVVHEDPLSRSEEMIFDLRPNIEIENLDGKNDGTGDESNQHISNQEMPDPEAEKLYELLKDYNKPLWPGCKNHSLLSVASTIMSIKSDYNLSRKCVDEIIQLLTESCPNGHTIPKNFYEVEKLVKKLELARKKIDCCVKGCMLYYKNDADLTECIFCGAPRYEGDLDGKNGRRNQGKRKYYLPLDSDEEEDDGYN